MEIFQQTPLGQFLAQLPGEQQQELVQGFVGDCILSTMNVSTREELEVGAVTGGGGRAGGRRCGWGYALEADSGAAMAAAPEAVGTQAPGPLGTLRACPPTVQDLLEAKNQEPRAPSVEQSRGVGA